MKATLPASLLERLSHLVAANLGLHFPRERWPELDRGIRSAAREFGFEEPEECIEWLASAPLRRRQVETLASHLTIGETYFFREQGSFKALEQQVLPRLISEHRGDRTRDRQLRIWSAACCTGEEAYSLAIAVTRAVPAVGRWDVKILATDINPHFLKIAADGVFSEWSFRDTPRAIRERYFRKAAKGRFEVIPEIKKLVTFDYLNLAEDAYPSLLNQTNGLDLIFCRNVLIYMGPEQNARLACKLGHCLADGGWLFVGAAEASHLLFRELTTVNFPGLIAYRKDATPLPLGLPALSNDKPGEISSLPVGIPKAAPAPALTPVRDPVEEASVLYEQGRYGDVVVRLSESVARGKGGSAASAMLSRSLANLGDLTAALAWCEKAIATEKLSPSLHYLRGTILQEKGDDSDAVKSFTRAIFLDPAFVMAHFALGHLARSRGRKSEAHRHLCNAAKLLRGLNPEEIVPESDGTTAGRLADVIALMIDKETTT